MDPKQSSRQLWRLEKAETEAVELNRAASLNAGPDGWLVDPSRETLELLLAQIPDTIDAGALTTLKLLHRNMRALAPATPIAWTPALTASTCDRSNRDGVSTVGVDFTAKVSITVRSLGAFLGNAKLSERKNPLVAEIWDRSTRKMMGKCSFSDDESGTWSEGGFIFKQLDRPLTLPAGFAGTLSAGGYKLTEQQLTGATELVVRPRRKPGGPPFPLPL